MAVSEKSCEVIVANQIRLDEVTAQEPVELSTVNGRRRLVTLLKLRQVADYARSTLEKSLSKVVKCRRGKPTGTTKVSAKRASDSERVRTRAQDSGEVVVSETKRTDAVSRRRRMKPA